MTATARRGFTLLELVLVLALVALLGAIAVASVSTLRDRGTDATAELQLQQVVSAQLAFAAREGRYTPDPEQLRGVGDLTVTADLPAGDGAVAVGVDEGGVLGVVTQNGSQCLSRTLPPPGDDGDASDVTALSGDCRVSNLLDQPLQSPDAGGP